MPVAGGAEAGLAGDVAPGLSVWGSVARLAAAGLSGRYRLPFWPQAHSSAAAARANASRPGPVVEEGRGAFNIPKL